MHSYLLSMLFALLGVNVLAGRVGRARRDHWTRPLGVLSPDAAPPAPSGERRG